MKTIIHITTIIFAFAFTCHNYSLVAQVKVDMDPIQAFLEDLDEEGKEYYMFFQKVKDGKSIDDEIRFWKFALLTHNAMYVEDGEIKTRVTEKDFVDIGFKPFFYKYYIKQLNELTETAKSLGEGYEEKIAEAIRESEERDKAVLPEAHKKLKELEAKKKEMEAVELEK